jgi:translocator protein
MNTRVFPRRRRIAIAELIGWIVLTFAFAAIGAFASIHAAAFYAQLDRPTWAPPAGVFGPVWTVLYSLMAIAIWRVGRSNVQSHAQARALYVIQLAVNALWSWLFFGWHQGALAFICIVVLWLLIIATTVQFGRHERLAAVLLWPYLAWVTFAGVLCFSIWQRNPAQLG